MRRHSLVSAKGGLSVFGARIVDQPGKEITAASRHRSIQTLFISAGPPVHGQPDRPDRDRGGPLSVADAVESTGSSRLAESVTRVAWLRLLLLEAAAMQIATAYLLCPEAQGQPFVS